MIQRRVLVQKIELKKFWEYQKTKFKETKETFERESKALGDNLDRSHRNELRQLGPLGDLQEIGYDAKASSLEDSKIKKLRRMEDEMIKELASEPKTNLQKALDAYEDAAAGQEKIETLNALKNVYDSVKYFRDQAQQLQSHQKKMALLRSKYEPDSTMDSFLKDEKKRLDHSTMDSVLKNQKRHLERLSPLLEPDPNMGVALRKLMENNQL